MRGSRSFIGFADRFANPYLMRVSEGLTLLEITVVVALEAQITNDNYRLIEKSVHNLGNKLRLYAVVHAGL